MKWEKKTLEDFQKGTFGNGGHNIYCSKKGVLQRIYNFDINGDGYPDLPIANSHAMNERPDLFVYDKLGQMEPVRLACCGGCFDGIFVDLNGDGTEDLVVVSQHNGVNSDLSATIYFGSESGLTEKYKAELRVPNGTGVTAGDFCGMGKPQLVFISNGKIRMFSPTELGTVEASVFEDYDIGALSVSSGDLDGDGYDDLYIMRPETGELAVYWGSENGINPDCFTNIAIGMSEMGEDKSETTAGRGGPHWVWRTKVVSIGGKLMTFRVDDIDTAVLESYGKDRKPKEELRVKLYDHTTAPRLADYYKNTARYCGVTSIATGDLRGDGSEDIALAYSIDCDRIDEVVILWQSEGYSLEKATRVPMRYPRDLSISPLSEGGKNYLFVAKGARKNVRMVDAEIFSFEKDGSYKSEGIYHTNEARAFKAGRTYTDGRYQFVAVNYEGGEHCGFEDVEIFLGGPDGYRPDRSIKLPGNSAVDVIMADINDDGNPDVFVVNCAEDNVWANPGNRIFWGGKDGFNPECASSFGLLKTPHGAAIGDFRHSGYIDIAVGAAADRRVFIFRNGPDGFDYENPDIILIGPDDGEIVHYNFPQEGYGPQKVSTPEDKKILARYGNARWIATADLNGDGWLDLFVTQIAGKHAYIFWGGPDGFSADRCQELAVDGSASAKVADLDGDGYPDLIIACHQSLTYSIPNERGHITIYWGGPDGFKENRKTELPTYCCNHLTVNDINNDGILDIYGTAYQNSRDRDINSKIYYGSEGGIYSAKNKKVLLNHSGCGALAADFNGDGYCDLLVISHKEEGNHENFSYIYWGGPDGINTERYTKLPCRGPHGSSSIDIGNVMDRSYSEYYYSEIFEIPDGMKPKFVSWDEENGVNTHVSICFRSAETRENVERAMWSTPIENHSTLRRIEPDKFIQYRIELYARCGCGTPRVSNVTVDFE